MQNNMLLIIPHAMSCWGYNVFDPSVSSSVLVFFLSVQLLWNRLTEFHETLYLWRTCILKWNFLLGVIPLLNLEKYTAKTVCRCNSSKTAEQNFVVMILFNNEGQIHVLCTLQKIQVQFFFSGSYTIL